MGNGLGKCVTGECYAGSSVGTAMKCTWDNLWEANKDGEQISHMIHQLPQTVSDFHEPE